MQGVYYSPAWTKLQAESQRFVGIAFASKNRDLFWLAIQFRNRAFEGKHNVMVTWETANLDRDERAMALAHAEYRETALDDRPLSALATSTFRAILKRAQEIKATLC